MQPRKTPTLGRQVRRLARQAFAKLSALGVETLRDANREQRSHLQRMNASRLDPEVTIVLLVSALILTLQYYFVTSADLLPLEWFAAIDPRLTRGVVWGTGHVILYLLIPMLCIRLLGRRGRDYGLKQRGAFSKWWVYLGCYLCMLPMIFVASRTASFQHTYPLYDLRPGEPLWPHFLVWEVFYALQFVALEFFFRGFMLHGTKRCFGAYAVLVTTVPYCMIHFQKPLPETIGAIVAGIVLGFMSLKTGSIWMGAVLHIAVAWTMDVLAIWKH